MGDVCVSCLCVYVCVCLEATDVAVVTELTGLRERSVGVGRGKSFVYVSDRSANERRPGHDVDMCSTRVRRFLYGACSEPQAVIIIVT